jgi:hypothetical protein
MNRKIGIDFDGTIHDSFGIIHETLCEQLDEIGIEGISRQRLREIFTADWNLLYQRLGIPCEHWNWMDGDWFGRYRRKPIGSLVPGSLGLLSRLTAAAGPKGISLITNEEAGRVMMFLKENSLTYLAQSVFSSYSDKAALFQEVGITDYLGDTVFDGECCFRAGNTPRFIGIAHKYAFNTRQMLESLKSRGYDGRVTIVNSLDEAAMLF